MNALVGYTGFVGSNIYEKGQIDRAFNSKNIEEAYGLKPDVLIYSGVTAEKYLANNAPEKDMEIIYQAQKNIEQIAPKKLVLISTIDVFKNPIDVNEETEIEMEDLHAYGLNRYRLECWAREAFPDALIIRLPGLFGTNIKKNFIYDFINVIPTMLKQEKFDELVEKNAQLKDYYELQSNGFYKCKALSESEREKLKVMFKVLNFTALNFTDSRSSYQFYPLSRLWDDIQVAIKNNLSLWHPATEPVSAGELYFFLTGDVFKNELGGTPANYDYKTIYDELYHGKNGYICDKQDIMKSIKEFVGGRV